MDSMKAFAMGEANRGNPPRVFDWNKAAEIIRDRNPESASAGLQGDMEWTGGEIWRDGEIVPREKTYVYLASTWATPILEIDGEEIPCFVTKPKTEWDSSTYWPESAKAILVRKNKSEQRPKAKNAKR